MAVPQRLNLTFGPLAKPLNEQLAEQGLEFINCELYQMDADAVARLFVRGMLTEAETTRAWKRLRDRVVKHIEAEMHRSAKP